jgi:ParB family chromosome partitioning protein
VSANPKHSAASVEHYTPSDIVEAARATMGSIDLDPASCELANQTVRAGRIFTAADDGLAHEWSGNVFLNPPGGKVANRSNTVIFWEKLCREWLAGRVRSAVFVAFSLEFLQTAQRSIRSPLDYAICIPRSRLRFLAPNADGSLTVGASPTHANAIVYMGGDIATFRSAFAEIGGVIAPSWMAA